MVKVFTNGCYVESFSLENLGSYLQEFCDVGEDGSNEILMELQEFGYCELNTENDDFEFVEDA